MLFWLLEGSLWLAKLLWGMKVLSLRYWDFQCYYDLNSTIISIGNLESAAAIEAKTHKSFLYLSQNNNSCKLNKMLPLWTVYFDFDTKGSLIYSVLPNNFARVKFYFFLLPFIHFFSIAPSSFHISFQCHKIFVWAKKKLFSSIYSFDGCWMLLGWRYYIIMGRYLQFYCQTILYFKKWEFRFWFRYRSYVAIQYNKYFRYSELYAIYYERVQIVSMQF